MSSGSGLFFGAGRKASGGTDWIGECTGAVAVVGGRAADPFFEHFGEDEGVAVSDGLSDFSEFGIVCEESIGGGLDADGGDVLHGGSAEFTEAEASKVFAATVGELSEFGSGPRVSRIGLDFLPKDTEAFVLVPGRGEALDFGVDELDPEAEQAEIGGALAFSEEALDCGVEAGGIGLGFDRGRSAHNGRDTDGFGVAYPAEVPGFTGDSFEGVVDAWGGE